MSFPLTIIIMLGVLILGIMLGTAIATFIIFLYAVFTLIKKEKENNETQS